MSIRPVFIAAQILVGLALSLCVASGMAFAVQPNLTPQARREFEDLTQRLGSNARKSEASRASARELALEIEALRRQLIDLANSEGISERRRAVFRARLQTLNIQERELTRKLGAVRNKQARLLSALQIYAFYPPPALLVSSRKANDAVRAAILLRAITPELRKRAHNLAEQNQSLLILRRQEAIQSEALFISDSDLIEQRARIQKLIADRERLEDQLLAQADRLDAERVTIDARSQRLKGHIVTRVLQGKRQQSLNLRLPSIGEIYGSYAPQDAGLAYGRGLSLMTSAGAQVIAPGEAEVEYAGPLPGYGQVIILNLGGDYRTVLTGLGRVFVENGASVARGEPIGRMPNNQEGKKRLYFELRRKDEAINPNQAYVF